MATSSTDPIRCRRCNTIRGYDNEVPTPDACEQCPPSACDQCAGVDDRYCECWVPLSGMALADIKASFADLGLSVSTTQP